MPTASDVELDYDEDACATDGCDGRVDDGEGWDGRCGACADTLENADPAAAS